MPTSRRENIKLSRFSKSKRALMLHSSADCRTAAASTTTKHGGKGYESCSIRNSTPRTKCSFNTATTSSVSPSGDNINVTTNLSHSHTTTNKDPQPTSSTVRYNNKDKDEEDMEMDIETISVLGSTTPDFTIFYTSDRFFFSYPGQSNSIIDSSPTTVAQSISPSSTSTSTNPAPSFVSSSSSSSYSAPNQTTTPATINTTATVEAVQTLSPDPYMDFRRSMEEVVEAYGLHDVDVRESWNSLHELLLCYLRLNPKETHKFIVEAFADLLVALVVEKESSDQERGREVVIT